MEKKENVGINLTVMPPRVVNVSGVSRDPDDAENVVPSENVSSEGLKSDVVFSPITPKSYEGLLCRYGNPEKYKDCIEYNTTFCHTECEFGPKKELPLPDVNLDYQREDGK